MADFLGSILGTMAGPPKASEKEIAERKKAREMAKKLEERNKQESKVFRQKIEQQIDTFLKGSLDNRNMTFEVMPKVRRSIVHDVAETAGLVASSFGVEDVDRHVVIWRKEFAPCEDELEAYRQGIEWDPVACAREKYEAVKRKKQEEEEDRQHEKKEKKFTPRTNYRQKYEHLIGTESALDAARVAEAKGSYGMVSAEEKKDKRTVEDIQAEIRAKKKMRLAEQEQAAS
eukprot:02440.XXX_58442_57564_1 [CDS] Oithona nana genome sequencing.